MQATLAGKGHIDARHLQRYCFVEDDHRLEDITSLLSAVRAADRSHVRHHSTGWARSLQVSTEVFDLALWRRDDVVAALTEALGFLTADNWTFTFTRRRRRKGEPSQAHLVAPPQQLRVFMPFSNGLDSYAIAQEVLAVEQVPELVLVNVQAKDRPTLWKNLGKKRGDQLPTVQVAAYADDPHRSELTFRSRPFLYDLLAGYGAAIAQPAHVVIPENGQGSLGGSLVPLGAEAPHRSCHPGFTSRLSRLLRVVTNAEVQFEHPALFLTKGQVLAGLARREPDANRWLSAHRSCSYDARHSSQDGRVMHCGVCGNCILRRVALHWAGVDDTTPYRAFDMQASSFAGAFGDHLPRNVAANKDVALNSVRSMQRMADLAARPRSPRVEAEVVSLARGLDKPILEIREKMEQLLTQHREEWMQFMESCGPQSWAADFAGS